MLVCRASSHVLLPLYIVLDAISLHDSSLFPKWTAPVFTVEFLKLFYALDMWLGNIFFHSLTVFHLLNRSFSTKVNFFVFVFVFLLWNLIPLLQNYSFNIRSNRCLVWRPGDFLFFPPILGLSHISIPFYFIKLYI